MRFPEGVLRAILLCRMVAPGAMTRSFEAKFPIRSLVGVMFVLIWRGSPAILTPDLNIIFNGYGQNAMLAKKCGNRL
jgi:hypothetical protein